MHSTEQGVTLQYRTPHGKDGAGAALSVPAGPAKHSTEQGVTLQGWNWRRDTREGMDRLFSLFLQVLEKQCMSHSVLKPHTQHKTQTDITHGEILDRRGWGWFCWWMSNVGWVRLSGTLY